MDQVLGGLLLIIIQVPHDAVSPRLRPDMWMERAKVVAAWCRSLTRYQPLNRHDNRHGGALCGDTIPLYYKELSYLPRVVEDKSERHAGARA